MHNTIVVPSDGTEGAVPAAMRALELAEKRGTQVNTLFLLDVDEPPDDPGSASKALLRQVDSRADEYLSELVSEAAQRQVLIETDVRRGDPVESILSYAREVDADAIVMGYQGYPHTSTGRSVVTAVREGADCEVILVDGNDALA